MRQDSVSPEALALFAKTPIPGNVKTRLQPLLSPAEAAGLYQAFAADAWSKLQQLTPASLYLYSDTASEAYSEWAGEHGRLQRGDDLGDRMAECFADLHRAGHQRILIVGSDSPSLPLDYLRKAFVMLRECDAVVGPAEDGGYYAVGCRQPHPQMFDRVTWSSPRTREQTEAAFRRVGYSLRLLPQWHDVDTFDDLRRLAAEPYLPPHTRAWLDNHAHLFSDVRHHRQQQARACRR